MKKRIFIALLSVLLLAGCGAPEVNGLHAGQAALAEENYAGAVAAFEKAAAEPEAAQLLAYAQACLDLENGEYDRAESGFRALGDFKDCTLMVSYAQARKQEALAEAALASGNADAAVSANGEACALYAALPLFRDCDTRVSRIRDELYAGSKEWMNQGSYEKAAAGFAALGDWQDCAPLLKYCEAGALEAQEQYVEAAEHYEEIPDMLDASARAEAARGKAYELAVSLQGSGDYLEAFNLFSALGSYRDAEAQRDSSSVLLVRTRLQSGAYADALKQYLLLSDPSVFPAVAAEDAWSLEAFLVSFVNVWMNAHAGVTTGFFSCSMLQPYLEPEGELDRLLHEELDDEETLRNYGFVFTDGKASDLAVLDEHFYVGKAQGSAICVGQEGQTETTETLWVLMDTRLGNPLAAAAQPA